MHVLHVYREANACVEALAKRGAHQHYVLSVYSSCPSFVYVCFVRDMAGLLAKYVPNGPLFVMYELVIL